MNQLKIMKKNQFNHRELDIHKMCLTREEAVNKFLSSKQGLAYLAMKYPKLTPEQAIAEYKKAAYYDV